VPELSKVARQAAREAAQRLQTEARAALTRSWARLMGERPRQDSGLTPTLFLVVDAIPHDLAQEVHAAGHLPGFAPPVAQVSVFPSLTNVAVGTLLRPAIDIRPPGYEQKYVHTPSGTVRGGVLDHTAEPGLQPYRTRPDTAVGLVAIYALRASLSRTEARWVNLRFRMEGGPWLGYLAATDGVAHFDGREALRAAFVDVCAQVCAARDAYAAEHGVTPHVVLCSDHGMEWGLHSNLDDETIRARLALEGFATDRLGPRGVLMAPMGEVGGGGLWSAPEDAVEVARLVSELPGVDLAVAREPGSTADRGAARVLRVVPGETTEARIEWRPDDDGLHHDYRYTPIHGDPLDLQPILAQFGDGWVPAGGLFAATWDHAYPDALHRIRAGLTDLVQHPASVLFSMKTGWSTGARLTHAGARVMGGQQGTHGGLNRQQSTGFVAFCGEGPAFDDLAAVPAVRAEHVMSGWRELVRAGSARPTRATP
jgi:hypothetical protein